MACAVLAKVSIFVLDPAEKFITSSPEYSGGTISGCSGSVVARYGKTYGAQTQTSDMRLRCCSDYDYWSSTIWKRTSQPNGESIPIPLEKNRYGELLVLAKDVVAVPAYSSLIITADLKVAVANTNNEEEEKFLDGTLNLLAAKSTVDHPEGRKVLLSEYACLVVSWFELPVGQLSLGREFIHAGQLSQFTPYNFVHDDDDDFDSDCESLVQVYSVFIGRDDDAELSIFGDIKAVNLDDTVYIYHRHTYAEMLLSGKKLLSLTTGPGPGPVSGGFPSYKRFLKIAISLRDASDRFHIDGRLKFIDYDWEKFPEEIEKKLDKLLCSVIQGKGGYCVVHHTIFRRAVPLLLGIDMMPHNSGCVSVCGTIAATYDMFDYTFDYDRKYYRIVLFDNNALVLNSDDPYPTFDCNLAMPVDGTSLCIHVDLHASVPEFPQRFEHLKTTLRYDLGDNPEIRLKGRCEMRLNGKFFSIVVTARKAPRKSAQKAPRKSKRR